MNPIKNGKQVFAVLSMATVMSISMSVKVNAASEIDAAAHTAANAVVQSENKNTSSSHTNVKTNSDASSEKREEVSAIDSKEASLGEKSAVVESANSLEISSENVGGPVASGDQSTGNVNTEAEQTSKATASEEKPAEATLSKLNSDENKATEDKTVEVNSEAKAAEKTQAADENLDVSEGKVTEPQKAPEEATEPNYSDEEKNIKNYSDSERYKTTDLTPGSTIVENFKTDEGVEKDGFKFDTLNPSKTSPSKTEYGYLISIDKKTGQRTYTKIVVSDSGRIPSTGGDKAMMGEGEKLTPDSPDVTYKPNEDGSITVNRGSLYEYEASEETLKHINNKDVNTTVIGMKDNYTQDNPNLKFFNGSNFYITYKVNPWPNENDKLELMKLSGEYNEKVFVQGQDIDTGVKVDNIDANAKDRLVGQVYNPITGKIVPGASAYIADDGNIHVKLPEGALKKDKDGKTVINEESIFNTPDFKALQNLDVKFFARPRTAGEFKTIAETPDDSGETGTYVETGAGSETINHKGTDVTIDKQGIDRYDHYNLIGKLKINLDDTRYYDQKFVDKEGNDTEKDTSIGVQPGEPFTVKMDKPEGSGDSYKTADEMNEAEGRGEAAGKLIMDFINRENKGKAEADQWKVKTDPKDIASFTITAPESAKAGDFIAIPVEYTYTNGSKDTKWFHFVVQESDYIKPEYDAQVNFPVNEQTSPAKVADNTKRIKPDRYSLPDTLETDAEGNKLATDDKGNKWTVKVDETTGKVTAKPVDPTAFDGGEKLTVPVIAHYVDEKKPGEDITEKAHAYFVIEEKANMTARYNAQAGKAGDELSSDAILNEEDHYNRKPGSYSLPDGVEDENGKKIFTDRSGTEWTVTEDEKGNKTFTNAAGNTWSIEKDDEGNNLLVDDKGNKWIVSIDNNTGKVTATVPEGVSNDKLDGALLNVPVVAHYYEKNEDGSLFEVGTKNTEVQFVATGADLNSPEYNVSIGDGNSEMKSSVVINADDKKQSPSSYTIDETKTYTDDKGNEWTVSIDPKTGEVKATPKKPSALKGGEKLQVPVTAHYGEGEKAPTHKTTAEFVVKDKEYASPDYDAKVVKPGESQSSDVKLPTDDSLKKPTKYTLDSTEFKDDKGNDWTVTIDETSGKVTATSPKGKKIDGAVLNVPVTAHYEDATGKEVTKKAAVQFIGSGTEGSYEYTETKPFETKVEVVKDLAPGEWRYKVVDGKEQKGVNGSVTYKVTIKDSKVEGEPETVKTVEPVNAIIEIGNKDYTGTVTHTEKIETPFEVEYQYSDELEAGQSKTIQKGEKGSYDLVYSQKIKNGQADGDATTDKKNVVEAKKEIIVIGTKPIVNVVEKPFDTTYVYDENVEAGKTEEVTPGVNGKTTTTTTYDQTEKKLVSKKETTEPTQRVVKVGTKPIVKTEEIPFEKEYEHDPNLEAGKTELISEGKKGEVKVTTTFNKETGKLETKVERTQPTPAKYKYGSKTEGKVTVTSDIPYEVEFVPDDTMAAGETKVTQEGKLGKKETTITIKNSKEESREEKILEEPVKKIVKIGTLCKAPTPGGDNTNPGGGNDNPSNPGGNDNPSNPGGNDSGTTGTTTDKPVTPGTPGETPNKPVDPNKPAEPGKLTEEKTPEGKTPEDKKFEGEKKISDSEKSEEVNKTEKAEKSQDEKELVKVEKAQEEKFVANKVLNRQVKDDDKAPKTGDAGLVTETASAGLASGLLLLLGRRKRRKEEGKKKNK